MYCVCFYSRLIEAPLLKSSCETKTFRALSRSHVFSPLETSTQPILGCTHPAVNIIWHIRSSNDILHCMKRPSYRWPSSIGTSITPSHQTHVRQDVGLGRSGQRYARAPQWPPDFQRYAKHRSPQWENIVTVSFLFPAVPIHKHVIDTSYTMRADSRHLFGSGGMYAFDGTTSLDGDISFASNFAGSNGGGLIGYFKLDDFSGCTFSFMRVYTPAVVGFRDLSINSHNSFVSHVRDPTSEALGNSPSFAPKRRVWEYFSRVPRTVSEIKDTIRLRFWIVLLHSTMKAS